MKRTFTLFFVTLSCLSLHGYQRSQAIDLLEHDLARLNIEKQRTQEFIDKTLLFIAGGFASFIGARKLLPTYKQRYTFHPSVELGAIFLDVLAATFVAIPLIEMMRKQVIKGYIRKVKQQISILKRKEIR